APDAWDSLAHYLRRNGVPLDLAEKLGLVRRNERGGYYDLFRNRLLFVISDMQGRAIAFGGRVLDNSLPKYINSPESAIYHKSEVLFGLHLSKQAIREEASALIVEGYFDHLALFQAGVKNCVATCGTALTNEHARLLKRYAERVYALFDGDSAGRKATVRALDIFLDEELPASVIEVTAGEDPDSFIRQQGVEAFRERQRTARPIFDYFYRTLVSEPDAGTIEGKKRAADELVTRLRRMKNQVERDLYLREVARGLGVPEASLRRMLGGGTLQEPQRNSDQPAAVRRISPAEMLISLMATFPEVVEMVRQHGVDRLFTGFLLTVAEELMRQVGGGEPVDWPRLLDILPSPEEKGRLSAILLNEPQLADLDPRKAFDQCCQSLERSSLGDFKELRRLLAVTDVESPRYRELLEEVERLRERKSRL
ncbi:MAG TPA: toprim domain-containing protein, partial [Geobacterales bacterium]|nr:toprim domain-containing protein [Geobacterales bacterium]